MQKILSSKPNSQTLRRSADRRTDHALRPILKGETIMDAIIYTTNTGSTRQYAKLLAQETGLPAYSFAEAKNGSLLVQRLSILAGLWPVRSRAMSGLRRNTRYALSAASAWENRNTDRQRAEKSVIPANIPLFTLQGNFNVKKLHGIYRFMMEIMVKTVGKGLAEKSDCTPEENDMQDMMFRGGERVKAENLSAILDWYRAQQ